MKSTTVSHFGMTPVPSHGSPALDGHLLAAYQAITRADWIHWPSHHRKMRLLGKGGQGVVFLSERQGTDGFTLPIALKFFSPEQYRDEQSYREDMARIGQTSCRVAQIQHDNLLDIHNFVEQDGIRVMSMEFLDGYDLREILQPNMIGLSRKKLSNDRWQYVNNVIITEGPLQNRLKPGVAIQVLRECLVGLAALHREGIVHGDLKPSNIMIKRTGSAKIIDIGSAVDLGNAAGRRMWSPAYAAPEVLQGATTTMQADLASLGYILVEMLAGQCPFEGLTTYNDLLKAKLGLEKRLPDLLPRDVGVNELLLHLCRRLISPDPSMRFPSAQAAELDRKGAADFHRQLVKYDLASEYENDLRVWLEQLA